MPSFRLNDPRWGRGDGNGGKERSEATARIRSVRNGKDGEGPPDLDEMWREFNRRLAGIFGTQARQRRAGGRPTTAVARGSASASSIGVLIAIYLGSGVFVVQDGHVGVVSQFGKYQVDRRPGHPLAFAVSVPVA